LLSNVDPTLVAKDKLEDMVMSGVNRLLSMQTPSGGFGVWPGETQPVPWGTAYVTHTLIDAQRQGFTVPQEKIDAAVSYLEGELTRLERGESGSQDNKYDLSPSQWEPYVHYVAALAGKPHKARAQKLIDGYRPTESGERVEQRYLLAAALHLAGDRRHEAELKKPDVSGVTDQRSWGWNYYSDLRRRGMALNVFQDLFGNDASGEPLARLVADTLRKNQSAYFSTQELSWGVSGLGKRVAGQPSVFGAAALTANGKVIPPAPQPKTAKTSDKTWALARASEYKTLTLEVPKVDQGRLYLMLSSQGVRQGGDYRVGGEGLQVHREYRTIDGKGLDLSGGSHKLGDLVFVKLEIKNTRSERITNIALVDRFPAGWEIENPRLGRGVQASWIDAEDLWPLDYMNVRDDRLEVFGSLNRNESRTVVYTLRAVTAGKFTVPPVEAEAMYDPRVWARDKGGSVLISGPWKENLL
jgi:alpha-2-macroglobulin